MTAKSGTWTLSNLLRLDVVREEKYMAARPRITIIGMGFVGTSLALGLQRVRGPKSDFEIVGHDKDNSVAGAAKKMGAVDRTDWNLIGAIDQADLVFVATPVSAIRDTLAAIGRHLKAGAIVTDTGGTKSQVMRWAAETLPDHVHFIGGDPLLGREGAPADTASADVFAKTLYCLTPAPAADGDAVRILADFITAMGAQPYFVDPDEHDGLVAAVAQCGGAQPVVAGAAEDGG
jgi:prephenate dehydrogenase